MHSEAKNYGDANSVWHILLIFPWWLPHVWFPWWKYFPYPYFNKATCLGTMGKALPVALCKQGCRVFVAHHLKRCSVLWSKCTQWCLHSTLCFSTKNSTLHTESRRCYCVKRVCVSHLQAKAFNTLTCGSVLNLPEFQKSVLFGGKFSEVSQILYLGFTEKFPHTSVDPKW